MKLKTNLLTLFKIFLLIFILAGCSSKNSSTSKYIEDFHIEKKISSVIPKDLDTYPQNAQFYTKNTPILRKSKEFLLANFKVAYFTPWTMSSMKFTKEEASWGNKYKTMDMYGENYQKITTEWFYDTIQNSNMDKYDSIRQKAITIKNSHLKVFPSHKPMFKDYTKAGEGFPFDYNQNTSIKMNTPIYISHYSKDKAWGYVSTTFAAGWIPLSDIAYITDALAEKIMNADELYVSIKDKSPLYKNSVFREYAYVGTIFPYRKNRLVTVVRDHTGKGYLSNIDTNTDIVPLPLPFNEINIATVINEMIGRNYGWGGLYNNRDCSLLTKDYFTVFGFAIERNSLGQTKSGRYIKTDGLTPDEKLILIKKEGIPFLSLIYIEGHIGLYLGTYNDVPLMFHSIWGIKTLDPDTNEDGRIIIGKSIISSLEIGKEFEIYDEEKSILEKMKGLVIIN